MLTMLVDTPSFSLQHDAVGRCLYATWRGSHNAEDTLLICDFILQHVRSSQAHSLLNDSSASLNGWHEIGQWLGMNYFPMLADCGVRAVAWVNPEDWPTRAHINKLLTYIKRPLVDTFKDVEAAHIWLLGFR